MVDIYEVGLGVPKSQLQREKFDTPPENIFGIQLRQRFKSKIRFSSDMDLKSKADSSKNPLLPSDIGCMNPNQEPF